MADTMELLACDGAMHRARRHGAVLLLLGMALVSVPAQARRRGEDGYAASWRRTLSVDRSECLVREPVRITVEWRNTSDTTRFLKLPPPALGLARDGRHAGKFELFRTMERLFHDHPPVVGVRAGEACKRTWWIALGVQGPVRDYFDVKWRFLFPSPGKWRLSLAKDSEASAEITVAPPKKEDDVLASEPFSVDAAAFFLGERHGMSRTRRGMASAITALESIRKDHPGSIYAPYAAVALASSLWEKRRPSGLDIRRFEEYLVPVVDLHGHHPLHEKALTMLIDCCSYHGESDEDGIRYARRLAREYPNSTYRIPRRYTREGAQTPQRNQPKVAKTLGSGTFVGVGFDKIPEGPRNTLHEYYKAVAEDRIDDAMDLLAPDFLGHSEAKERWRERLNWSVYWYNKGPSRFEVESCEKVRSYSLPAISGMRGDPKSWQGEIVVVSGRRTSKAVNRRTGEEETSRSPGPRGVIVLRRYEPGWRIVSYRVESRNRKAGSLAGPLYMQMRRAFGSVIVWDGKKDVLVRDALKARLSLGDGEIEMSWKSRGLRMLGEQRDEPQVRGDVVVRRPGGQNDKSISRHPVTLHFVLDGDRLRLERIETHPSDGPGDSRLNHEKE